MTEHSAVAVDRARLRLLGGWQLLVEGVPIGLGHREQRLLAVLSLGEGGARAQVASALWPDSTDERALASLRRAVLQCQKRVPGLLDARRTTIALVPEVAVDVDDLRRAAGLTELPMSDGVARELLVAMRGEEFLPGWYDDWVAAERERLAQLRVEAFDRIAVHGLDAGDLLLALDAARSASDIEPLLEWPREVAIRAHVGRGDLASALHEYQRYCGLLQEELGVAPSSRIVELLEPLADSRARAPAPVELPRPRLARPEESLPVASLPPAPPPRSNGPMSLDSFLDGDGPPSGTRSAILALVGAAGLALAASLAVALSGPDRAGEPTTDPQAGVSVSVPTDTSTPLASDAARPPTRQVDVRALDSVDGSAAFTVRATLRPAEVTLVVRGRAGVRVVRHLVVRGAGGRQVVLDGLEPGTYQWSASSPSASQVEGVVSVETTEESPDSEESASAATTVPAVTPVVATTTPTATTSASQTPSPHPSPSTSPTGRPSDPGSVPPTPVG